MAKKKAEKKENTAKHPGGRPTIYTKELAETIFDQLSDGIALLEICQNPDMPARTTVYRWRAENKEFRYKLARARKLYGLSLVDRLKQMADNLHGRLDTAEDTRSSNDRIRALADVTKAASNIYMWIAGKSYPKLFGDNSKQTVKADLTIKEKENISIDERVNRIGDLIAKKKKISGEDK